MRFIITVVFTFIAAAVAENFLPWWIIAVVAFAIALMTGLRPGKSFLAGFLAIALFWFAWSLRADDANDHILSAKMAALFNLPHYSLFILLTALVGGLVGGMSAWSGSLIRSLFNRKT